MTSIHGPSSVAIYARISRDPSGAHLGVDRQLEDCRKLAADRGWRVAEEYVDNDVSAYSGKRRPAYERMLADIDAGARDAVIAYHTDRLHRRPTELETYIDVCDPRGVATYTVRSGDLDLATPQGRMIARVHGAIARGESEKQSDRLKRAFRQQAEQGKPKVNGPRPFGYEADGLTIRPDEAAIVRDLAERFLAGESLSGLTRWLNEQGVPTATGHDVWWSAAVRQLVGSARISGQRAYHGKIVGPALWPAIITPEMHARIRRVLDDPARKHVRSPSRYLLTGLIFCGLCGRPLISHPKNGQAGYDCRRDSGLAGCGRISTKAEPVEELVRDMALDALDGPDLEAAVLAHQGQQADSEPLITAVATDKARLAEIAETFADGDMTRDQFTTASRRVNERLQANLERLAAGTNHRDLTRHLGRGEELRAGWQTMTLDQRRAVIRAVVATVSIGPAGPHKATFNPTGSRRPGGSNRPAENSPRASERLDAQPGAVRPRGPRGFARGSRVRPAPVRRGGRRGWSPGTFRAAQPTRGIKPTPLDTPHQPRPGRRSGGPGCGG